MRSPQYRGRTLETLVLQSTPFCNIDCAYCYLPHRSSKQRMSEHTLEQTFRRVFSSPFVNNHLTVLWHAGEPLVLGVDYYRTALELLERHRRPDVSVTVHFQTNGTLLNQEWIDFFRATGAQVGVSLDGPAELHDRSRKTRRGTGTYQEVMRGVRLLQSNDFSFHVITVLTRESLRSAAKMFEFYAQNHITDVAFNVEEIEGIHNSSSLGSDDASAQMRGFLRDFFELAESQQPGIRVRELAGAFQAIVNAASNAYGNPMVEPLRFVSVGVNGEISTFSPELLGYGDARHPTFVFGNVHDNELADILQNPAFLDANAEIERGISKCQSSCQYFDLCLGGVPGNKFFENGTFDSGETLFCRLAKQAVIDVVLERVENSLGITC
jgi:uncharacterized protein